VGIELGTTYSCVAVWIEQHRRVEITHNDQGSTITPSFVIFTGCYRLIGGAAKHQTTFNPKTIVFGIFSSFLSVILNICIYTL